MPQTMLSPAGPAARQLADLGVSVVVGFLAVSIVMWILVWWVASRRTGTLAEHLPWTSGGGENWILIGGIAIPGCVFVLIFILALQTMSGFPQHDGHHLVPTIRIIGHQWWWEAEYLGPGPADTVRGANEIHIPAGVPVDIELISRDVIHSFWIPRLHGKVDLIPGQVTHIRLQADRPGRYRGSCAEYCGRQHAHMLLVVSADAPSEFSAWLTHERSLAAMPVGGGDARGKAVFLSRQCAFCHTVRGTPAGGTAGPDLTHVGSRFAIASNMLPNVQGNVERWVTHAQSIKPGVQMPDIEGLTDEDVQALAAYLKSLR
jgi:cytochrome c oxidase subunit II